MKVGDEGKDRLVPNLHKLLTVTCSKEQSNHDDIINYCLFGISHLPDKSGIYAAYLALLNLNSHSLSVEICTQAAKLLEHAVTNNDYLQSKILLRFFFELSNANFLKPLALTDLIYSLLHSQASSGTLSAGVMAVVTTIPFMVKLFNHYRLNS